MSKNVNSQGFTKALNIIDNMQVITEVIFKILPNLVIRQLEIIVK